MNLICKKIVEMLKKSKKTISCMESCTGGLLANEITNISGASEVLKVSLITYSNEYKIKFGVNKDTIDKYTVYSSETAEEMAKNVADFANADFGIGITGNLDETGTVNKVYYSVYVKETNKNYSNIISISGENRELMKKYVVNKVLEEMYGIC